MHELLFFSAGLSFGLLFGDMLNQPTKRGKFITVTLNGKTKKIQYETTSHF